MTSRRRGAPHPGQPSEVGRAPRISKRALDAVFDDVLPDTTRDERDDRESGDDRSPRGRDRSPGEQQARRDADLRREVPPHHG